MGLKPGRRNPSVSSARSAAFDILQRVEQQHAYASELLHSSQYSRLSIVDHGLATELVMGVIRWRSVLDASIAKASSSALDKLDIEVLISLRLGAYQLHFLERIPARAAIHESVEIVKRAGKSSAAGFVNAVLRKLESSDRGVSSAETTTPEGIAQAYAHPQWLVRRWTDMFGLDQARAICDYNQQIPQSTIRLRDPAAERELPDVELAPGELLSSARRLSAGDPTRTRAFREGRIALQDEASQLVATLVGRGSYVLDCCAAPGGKTAILAEGNPAPKVIAVELHPHRARLLRKLVPAKNVNVIAADARRLPFSAKFDRILADVPCSGTGTLARNPDIKWRLTPEDLADLEARQIAILRSAMSRLRAGGRLVYSTCSLEPEENSQVIERVLSEGSSFRLLECGEELERLKKQGELIVSDPSSLVSGPYLRTIPGIHHCDGFFAAILESS